MQTTLESRGRKREEVDAIFTQYDADGDRILNEAEQAQLQADLNVCISISCPVPLAHVTFSANGERHRGRRAYCSVVASHRRCWCATSRDEATQVRSTSPDYFVCITIPIANHNARRRVDRLENSIGSVVSKIDAILLKLEDLEAQKISQQQQVEYIIEKLDEGKVDPATLQGFLREAFDAPVGDELAVLPNVITNEVRPGSESQV